jgi:hypothetical protein
MDKFLMDKDGHLTRNPNYKQPMKEEQLRKELHNEIDLLGYDLLLLIAKSIGIR